MYEYLLIPVSGGVFLLFLVEGGFQPFLVEFSQWFPTFAQNVRDSLDAVILMIGSHFNIFALVLLSVLSEVMLNSSCLSLRENVISFVSIYNIYCLLKIKISTANWLPIIAFASTVYLHFYLCYDLYVMLLKYSAFISFVSSESHRILI